jgi:hypothetical protein
MTEGELIAADVFNSLAGSGTAAALPAHPASVGTRPALATAMGQRRIGNRLRQPLPPGAPGKDRRDVIQHSTDSAVPAALAERLLLGGPATCTVGLFSERLVSGALAAMSPIPGGPGDDRHGEAGRRP